MIGELQVIFIQIQYTIQMYYRLLAVLIGYKRNSWDFRSIVMDRLLIDIDYLWQHLVKIKIIFVFTSTKYE